MTDQEVTLARWLTCAATGLLCILTSQLAWGENPKAAAPISKQQGERIFTLRVLPLLKVKCFGCHGNDPKDVRLRNTSATQKAVTCLF
jgi:mono/diheme cytochrome c family protein